MANMQKAKIIMVIDKSGSMAEGGKRIEAISGFNKFIADQQTVPGEATLSAYLFDTTYLKVIDNAPIKEVKQWTEADYAPSGMTALLDAVGRGIDEAGKDLATLPEDQRPAVVIFAILTDGEENSSREYSKAVVAEKIKHQTEKYNWQFLYLGNNLDTAADKQQAVDLGIIKDNIFAVGGGIGMVSRSYGTASARSTNLRTASTTGKPTK